MKPNLHSAGQVLKVALLAFCTLLLVPSMQAGNKYLQQFENYSVMSMGGNCLRFKIPVWVYGEGSDNTYYLHGYGDKWGERHNGSYIWYSTSDDVIPYGKHKDGTDVKNNEWDYLLSGSGRTNANNLQSPGTVNGVYGYIILPDDWSTPAGLSFTPTQGDWTTNVYSGDNWTAMENAGAVFFPCAGYRNGNSLTGPGEYGYYWTSSNSSDTQAYCWGFSHSYSITGADRCKGHSVRLVIDAD